MSGDGPAIAAVIVAGSASILAFLGGAFDRRWQRQADRVARTDQARREVLEHVASLATNAERLAYGATVTPDPQAEATALSLELTSAVSDGRIALYVPGIRDDIIHASRKFSVLHASLLLDSVDLQQANKPTAAPWMGHNAIPERAAERETAAEAARQLLTATTAQLPRPKRDH